MLTLNSVFTRRGYSRHDATVLGKNLNWKGRNFMRMKMTILGRIALVSTIFLGCWAQTGSKIVWKHLSTKAGDLEPPNSGGEQTSATIFDVEKDSLNDFIITEW